MFHEVVHSEGLAHLSYVVGDKGEAAVIDPRRDSQVYVDIAYGKGARITHIFETHRNEDYVIGSVDLARRTGAKIYHGKALPFTYGNPVAENDTFTLGSMVLRVLETPGHTYESISIALSDKAYGEEPVAVFTGDALFVGDVGRTDFFPDRAEKVAGLLYDSIFRKLLPLGDHVILYPAHGAGSVCGSGIASREFSTLGYERKHNPVLQKTDRKEFIRYKVSERHYQPPYFRRMEKYNLEGPPPLDELPSPVPLSADRFAEATEGGMLVVDTRSPEAFAGAHIPGTLSIPLHMIPGFAGFFLPYDRKILLVTQESDDVEEAVRYFVRIGYDEVAGYLEGELRAWEMSGRPYASMPVVHARDLERRMTSGQKFTLLDVRSEEEWKKGHLPGALHVYVGDLPGQLDRIPKDRCVTTYCASGGRAMIAASILRKSGFTEVEDSLGSMSAWRAIGGKVVSEDKPK
jgi:hydroxyacylglutathione hydrolase